MVVISSPTLISQLMTTCFYLKYLSNPLTRTCLMVVSTLQLLLHFLGEMRQFLSFTGRTAWLGLFEWGIVAGQLRTGTALCVLPIPTCETASQWMWGDEDRTSDACLDCTGRCCRVKSVGVKTHFCKTWISTCQTGVSPWSCAGSSDVVPDHS